MYTILNFIAENRIQQALDEGQFNSLAGFGKPIDNSEYMRVKPELRMAWTILKNHNLIKEEKIQQL